MNSAHTSATDHETAVSLKPIHGWTVHHGKHGCIGKVLTNDFGFVGVCDATVFGCGFETPEAMLRDVAVGELIDHHERRHI